MPAGIQVFDPASGQLRLDYTDRMFKFFGVAQVGDPFTGAQASGQIQHGLFTAYAGNVPFAFAIAGELDNQGNTCVFSFSGDVLTWTFPQADPAKPWTRPGTVFAYGIY